MTGKASARHGSMVIVVAVGERAHVQLAGRGDLGAVGLAVDHQAAHAADALAAVGVERDRLLALGVELLVEHVEHLEERHVRGDVVDLVGVHRALGAAAPAWRQILRVSLHL